MNDIFKQKAIRQKPVAFSNLMFKFLWVTLNIKLSTKDI